MERIAERVGLDVGGIEYLIDDRDGKPYFYDINALSNFVADAQNVIGFDPFVRFVDYIESRAGIASGQLGRSALTMRYGYWLPVFGGWLRNVPDEGMEASWEYVKRLAQRSEQIGYDLTLIAELFLNDIKGIEAPSLEAWSTAAALAAVTERLELMVAVRPTFHNPAILAKQAANLDLISGGRLVAQRRVELVGRRGAALRRAVRRARRPLRAHGGVAHGRVRRVDARRPSRTRGSTTGPRRRSSRRSRCAGRDRRSTPAASPRRPSR